MFEGLSRRFAVWRYRGVLPYALVRRYGRNPSYTPAQVLATIRATGLSERYVVYACALFCSKRAVREHAEKQGEHLSFDNPAGVSIAAMLGFSLLSEYDNLRAEIGMPSDAGDASDAGLSASTWGDAGGDASDFGGGGDSYGDGGGGGGGDSGSGSG